MASVHFYLNSSWSYEKIKEKQKSNPSLYNDYLYEKLQILCFISTIGKRIKVYTSKRIEPVYWDFEKERANTKLYKKHGVVLNDFLNHLQSSVELLAEQNENKGKVTGIEEIRELIEPRKARQQVTNQSVDFDGLFQTFIREHKTEKGFPIRVNTIKKYNGFKRYLEEYAKIKYISITLDTINLETLSLFQTFLNDKEKMSDSTKAKYIKAFKTFIKYYQKQRLIPHFDMSEVKAKETEGETYVVPLQRLITLQNTVFKNVRLAKIRDQFCFMCWTGQRFGDYLAMKKTDLFTDEFGNLTWKLTAKKITHGKLITVPIIEYAQEILNRFKGDSLPTPTISNQKFNEALKEMAKNAKLDFEVKTVRYYNGFAKTNTVPFYQVLSAHVARKTYITCSLVLGVPERVVREVSGHKDEKSFRRYINFADSYKVSVIHQAFNRKNVERVLRQIGSYEKFTVESEAA